MANPDFAALLTANSLYQILFADLLMAFVTLLNNVLELLPLVPPTLSFPLPLFADLPLEFVMLLNNALDFPLLVLVTL